jgi:hypothetical protein
MPPLPVCSFALPAEEERRDGKRTPLEKLTARELKEMALAMGGITGGTATDKES